MFYSGLLCGSSGDQESEHAGHLHVLKKGRLKITRPDARQIVIDTPSILFFPRPRLHRLHGPEEEGAALVCATIEFGAGMLNPLIASLPEPLVLPLDALPDDTAAFVLRGFLRITRPSGCHRSIIRICLCASHAISNEYAPYR
jgi:hypothetical protein